MADPVVEPLEPEEIPTAPAPAEEFVSPLDRLLAADDEPAPAVEPVTSETALEEETPPAEEPPAKEEPPAETPPAETLPAETPPEQSAEPDAGKKGKPNALYTRLREAERRAEAAERRAQELEQQPKPASTEIPPDEEIDDPIEKIAKNQERLEKKLDTINVQTEAQRVQREIKDQETAFAAKNPDYNEAVLYLVEEARKEFTHDGTIGRGARELLAKSRAQVEEFALANNFIDEQTGEPDLNAAAKEAAFRGIVHQRRNAMVTNWLEEGKDVAEAAHEFAKAKGFKSSTTQPDPKQQQNQTDAQRRVQAAKAQMAATQSLSAMQPAGSKPLDWRPRTRADIQNLTDAQFEQLEEEDPDWLKRVPR
jgi:hypothetical protein